MENERDEQLEARQTFFEKQKLIESARISFHLLAAVLRNISLYPHDHPILLASAEKFRDHLQKVLTDRKEAAFYLVRGELFFETFFIPIDNSFSSEIYIFQNNNIDRVIFK